jgi:hypothetical protein
VGAADEVEELVAADNAVSFIESGDHGGDVRRGHRPGEDTDRDEPGTWPVGRTGGAGEQRVAFAGSNNSPRVSVYLRHYNTVRPHRSLQLQPPCPACHLTLVELGGRGASVQRVDVLGGLIHEYRRAA